MCQKIPALRIVGRASVEFADRFCLFTRSTVLKQHSLGYACFLAAYRRAKCLFSQESGIIETALYDMTNGMVSGDSMDAKWYNY